MRRINRPPKSRSLVHLILLATLLVALISACSPAPEPTSTPRPTATPFPCPDIFARGKIVVGTSLDYPPFEFWTPAFTKDGYDMVLIQEIGRRLGLPVEIQDLAFDFLGNALLLNQVDLAISAISITPERQSIFAFSTPYLLTVDGILARPDSTFGTITTIEQMIDKRVGVQSRSVYEKWLQTTLVDTGRMPEGNLHVYSRMNDAAVDLQAGKLDLIQLDLSAAEEFARLFNLKLVGQGLNAQTLGIGFRQGCATLQTQVNEILAQLQAEGYLKQLGVQYLGLAPDEIEPIPTPAPPLPTLQPTAGPPPACVDGMAFVQDLTYPDFNMTAPPIVMPGTPFIKGWRIRNSGSCTWDSRYLLTYVSGNTPAASMGGRPTPISGTVAPGQTFDMFVSLVAPVIPGVYQGFWELKNQNGASFGNRLWVGITVPPANPATPTPAPGLPFIFRFNITPSEIQVGQCVNISWEVQGTVSYVNLLRNGSALWLNGPATGSINDCPPGAGVFTYQLQAFGQAGQTSANRQLNVIDTPQPTSTPPPVYPPYISSFNAAPSAIQLGQCVTLNWAVDGTVDKVQLTRNDQVILDNASNFGQANDCPPQAGQVRYSLRAYGAGQQTQADQLVDVAAPPPSPTSPPPFLGMPWSLVSYMDTAGQQTAILAGTEITLTFTPDSRFNGFAGCNDYNGRYQSTANQLLMVVEGTTQKACAADVGAQESTYLSLLGMVDAYQYSGSQLLLFSQSGQLILTFQPQIAPR